MGRQRLLHLVELHHIRIFRFHGFFYHSDYPKTYSVIVTDDAGCSSIDSVLVGYGQPSIQIGEINSSAFVLYPNPFQNQLVLNTNYSGEIELSLFNLSGELICVSNSKKINTKSLKSGVYLIKVALGEKIYRQRVFKY